MNMNLNSYDIGHGIVVLHSNMDAALHLFDGQVTDIHGLRQMVEVVGAEIEFPETEDFAAWLSSTDFGIRNPTR